MKLRRLEVRALAGIETGFVLDEVSPGLNVIVGPNGSGKSSLGRALRALFGPLPPDAEGAPVHLVAEFDDAGSRLRAVRTGSQLVWERDGQPLERGPALPEPRLLGCFTIEGDALVPRQSATDAEIGARLVRELAGGYDLERVRELFAVKPRRAPTARIALARAEKALTDERGRHERIRRDEAGLAELREALADADAAAAQAELCASALRLLEARAALASARAALALYPAGMERLAGDERERLDALDARDRALVARHAELSETAHEAGETVAQHAGLEADAAALRAAQGDLATLAEHERAFDVEARACEEADAVLADAVRALGGEPPGEGLCIDRAAAARAEAALEAKRVADAARDAALALLDALPVPAPPADVERLREDRRDLLRWLSAPGAWARTIGWLLGAVVTVLAVVTGLGAAALVRAESAAEWAARLTIGPVPGPAVGAMLIGALVLSGAALGIAVRAARAGETRGDVRARIVRDTGAVPASWDARGVRAALDAVDVALRDALGAERERARRAEAEARLARVQARCEATRHEIAAGTATLGFDPLELDASVPRWLALAARWDAARADAERTRAALARRGEVRERAARRVRAFLSTAGQHQPGEDAPASVLEADVSRAGERIRARDDAAAALAEGRRELVGVQAQRVELRDARAALLARAGLDGEAAAAGVLDERLARLDSWRADRAAERDCRAVEAERAAALSERGAPDAALARALEDGASEVLVARRDAALERARDRDEHSRDIGRIETEIAAAGAGRALERARADVQSARTELEQAREALLDAEAGAAMVDLVERDHVATTRPEVLARAGDLLERFTHHRFSLDFDPRAARFTARDNEAGATRSLETLSSGTRAQLLLAVRLAFAREVEPAGPLPLLLDEALANADPERHLAVAESVAAIVADERRQVFYLSAQPGDLRFWTGHDGVPAAVHDLARIRGAGRAIDARSSLAPLPSKVVPEPGDGGVAAYAAAVGALRDDPWLAPGSVHPLHLLHDDLALVRRLVLAGVESAGALQVLLDSDAAGVHLRPDEIDRLRWRLRVLEAYRSAWREGRGRPLTRAEIADAPSIGAPFVEAVGDALEACDGDAAALLEALESGAVKRFRRAKIEELRTWLRERRHLDPRPVLDSLQRALRVESLVRDVIDSGAVTTAEVRQVITWLDAARATGLAPS